jgi:hemoglobin/transferrin/lactoferrin receptor protein
VKIGKGLPGLCRRALALVVLLAASAGARPHEGAVEGRVVAAGAGTPLAGAYVTVEGTRLGTAADAEGRYLISRVPVGNRRLTASFVGYRTASRSAAIGEDERVRLDFPLEISLLPVDAVIVTARGTPSRLAELAGSAGVVNALDISRINPVSLPEAAAALAGVSVGSDMPWSSRVQIRGLGRDHVVFLVNGDRLSTTNDVAAQFGMVVLADLEQVEVLKGPISVLYGTGSTGGVVNVIPYSGKFASAPQWTLATTAAGESAARGFTGYSRAGFNSPSFYLMLSQSYRDHNSYRAGGGERIPNSQFRDYQSHLNLGYRLSRGHFLDLRYQWFEARDVGIPGAGGVFPTTASVTYPRTGRWLAETSWRWVPSASRWRRSELKLFVQTIDRRAQVVSSEVRYLPPADGQPLRRVRPQLIAPSADHDAAGVRWHNELTVGAHDLVFGVEGWQKSLTSIRRRVTAVDVLRPDSTLVETVESRTEDRSLPSSVYRPIGLYAEDEFHPCAAMTLDLGARIDLIHIDSEKTYKSYVPLTDEVLWTASSDRDLSWSAQSRATFALVPGWNAHANLCKSFRSPGLEERYLYVDLGDLVRIGDPGLDSEDGFFLETGISARTSRLLWNAQAFLNRIKNLVVERSAAFEGRRALEKANAGVALFAGFESDLSFSVSQSLLAAADLAYVRGRDEKKHEDLPAIEPLNGRLSIRAGGYQRLWGGAELEFSARQGKVAPGESPTDGHYTLNLSVGYGGLRTGGFHHRLAAGLKNALDADYRDHLTTSRGFALKAPGRNVYASWSTEL